ncbi:fimbrial protein [Erwiniaceae bacterium CAU 1747]
MELKKIVLGVALAMGVAGFTGFAQADEGTGEGAITAPANQGSGSFKFYGEIINAPCSIKGEKDQTVNLGQISNSKLKDGASTPPTPFYIRLDNCDVTTKKSVSVTFSGPSGTIEDSLGMSGVSGASIIMTDGSNNKVKLGQPTSLQEIINPDETLTFGAYVQGNPGETVTLGSFEATTNFTLAYQ